MQSSVALPLEGSNEDRVPLTILRKAKSYTPHQRLILKAQALFPGSEIISHSDIQESR